MASVLRRALSTSAARAAPPQRVLITGALGQLGTGLTRLLRSRYGAENVVASDIRKVESPDVLGPGPFVYADALRTDHLERVVVEHGITSIIHFSALLSAVGERNPLLALDVNIRGFQNVMELARNHQLMVFCPSTIGAFGPSTPADNTPDLTIMRPTTIYGITKIHTELLGEYYAKRYGVDFRSVRYPGIISAETMPGGGTTDYAVDIFHKALDTGSYDCFLEANTRLPMMYYPDCLEGTVQFLETPRDKLKQATYNMAAISFTPAELAAAIRKHVPLTIKYSPDFRQAIANSWPRSLDDSNARRDWNWAPKFDLDAMVADMIKRLRPTYKK